MTGMPLGNRRNRAMPPVVMIAASFLSLIPDFVTSIPSKLLWKDFMSIYIGFRSTPFSVGIGNKIEVRIYKVARLG